MIWSQLSKVSVAALALSIAGGLASGYFVSLPAWQPAFPGILVALSMLGAAVLVRLARNAPITAPATFDAEDFKAFFDTLEILAARLFAIFCQVVACIFILLSAVIVQQRAGDGSDIASLAPWISGLLGGILIWLTIKILEMARGDIGFLRLQRRIIENALRRQNVKDASAKVEGPIEFKSPGGFGRALPKLSD